MLIFFFVYINSFSNRTFSFRLCHIVALLANKSNTKSSQSGSFIGTILNAYQTLKTAQSVGNFLGSLNNLDKSDNTNEKSNENYSLLNNFLNMMNNQQTTPATVNQNSNGPLNAVLDYFSNSNNGLSLMGRKKKNPTDYEDYVNGLASASSMQSPTVAKTEEPAQQIAQLTPTACPSIGK